jgi:hypothetical protein
MSQRALSHGLASLSGPLRRISSTGSLTPMTTRTGFLLTLTVAFFVGVPRGKAAEADRVVIKATDENIEFFAGKQLVTRYHKESSVAKPYFWPLNVAAGDKLIPVTRAWPMEKGLPGESNDHVHQKSAWFCHGDVIPEGLELKSTEKVKGVAGVDFWSETPGHGVIACTGVDEPKFDGNHGQVKTRNEWRTAEGTRLLDETRIIHFYNLGNVWLFVVETDLNASVCPITFGDTKEGSIGIRINDAITEEKVVDKKKVKGEGKIENAEGKIGEKDCWGFPSAWCDYSGPIDGQTVGLALFTDPSNPLVSCWHSRGYGLMAANPFGRDKAGFPAMKGKTDLVRLAKGEHLKMRFGLLLHTGDAREGKVGEYYERFVKLKG